jgi:hypothetical protein
LGHRVIEWVDFRKDWDDNHMENTCKVFAGRENKGMVESWRRQRSEA